MLERLANMIIWKSYEMKTKIEEGIDNALEAVEVVTSDVKDEGHKRGYERAVKEYNVAFQRVKNEYDETKEIFNAQITYNRAESSRLLLKLKELNEKKKKLELEVAEKSKKVSRELNIPLASISDSLKKGKSIIGIQTLVGGSVFYLIYRIKKMKLNEAEVKGYEEAKLLYEQKIRELQENLKTLRNKGTSEMQELMVLISDIMQEISEEEMAIAELKIILHS